jgi:hypothetical protein
VTRAGYVEQSGAGVLVCENNACSQTGASGPAVVVGTDNVDNAIAGINTTSHRLNLRKPAADKMHRRCRLPT